MSQQPIQGLHRTALMTNTALRIVAPFTDPFGDYVRPALCSVAPPVDPPSARFGTPPPASC